MPKLVDIQGVGVVSFPDEMSDEDISSQIESNRNEITQAVKPEPDKPSSFTDKLAALFGASAEETGIAATSDIAQGVSEAVKDLIPKTGKDVAMLGGLAALTAVAPPVGGLVIAGLGAKGAGEAAGDLSVAIKQGDDKEIAKAATLLTANALFAKQGSKLVTRVPAQMAARAAEAKVDIAKQSLTKEQQPLPPASLAESAVQSSNELVQNSLDTLSESLKPEAPVLSKTAIPSGDPQALGITPNLQAIGPTPTPAGLAVSTAKKMNSIIRGVTEEVAMLDLKDNVSAGADAMINMANNHARQVANEASLDIIGRSTPSNQSLKGLAMDMFSEKELLDRAAITPIIESGVDFVKLTDAANKVLNTVEVAPELKRVYAHAVDNFNELAPKASKVSQAFEDQLSAERQSGMDVDSTPNYVTHRYDFDVMLGPNKPVVLSAQSGSGSGGGGRFYTKQRVFNSYADAITFRDPVTGEFKGFTPKTMDVVELLEHRIRAGQRAINARAWAEGMRNVNSPVTGTPLVVDMITQPKGTQVAPLGYQPWEFTPGMRVALNDTIAPLIKSLDSNGLPAWVMKPVGFHKHVTLAIDTFHAMRMMYRGMGLGEFGYNKGKSLLEYNDKSLSKAIAAGEITPETASWVKTNRPTVDLLQQHGLNVGRISDALYKDMTAHIPVLGPFTRFVFDKLTRGMMAQTGVKAYQWNTKMYPELSAEQVARKTAKELNSYFGNLMNQGIFKDKKFQDVARLVFLAPQWVESMARTELGAVGQALKIPVDLARGKGLRVGTLARGVGTSTLGFFIVNQLINHFTQGGFTWETNPDGHKLDAYVPDWMEGTKGYWMSPLGSTMELTHDYTTFSKSENKMDALTRLAANKAGLATRLTSEFFGKTLGEGKPLVDPEDRIKSMINESIPQPLGMKMFQQSYLGSKERQAASSIGIKLEKFKTEQEEKRAAKGKAFARYEDVVQAAIIDIRKDQDKQAEVLKWAREKLEPRQWSRARAEIARRSRRN